jgi:hypothetical protein
MDNLEGFGLLFAGICPAFADIVPQGNDLATTQKLCLVR